MSCAHCHTSADENCFESRLSIGVKQDKSAIVGSLDRVSFTPIPIKPFVQANETITSLRYDPTKRALVYNNEKANRGGSADYVEAREILSGASIAEVGGVGALVQGGMAYVALVDGELQLLFSVPSPIEVGETAGGFITHVTDPNDGTSHLRTIRPDSNGTDDSLLIGHPNGSIEFSTPIASPLLIPVDDLTSDGVFNGTPAVASGTWRYQSMGQSPIVNNTSGSKIEVVLNFRFSLVTAGSHSGVYCTLTNGGSDYKTAFIDGSTNAKQEGYPAGYAEYVVTLDPNQKCQFNFGAWTNASGNMEITIGSINEAAGVTGKTAYAPTIRIRRLV